MNRRNKHVLRYQGGFSLVELMVGLVIGLLVALVIMQVFSVFEGQKRTTMGTADAQTNGAIALYSIKRELQMAGYGLLPSGEASVADSAIDCSTLTIDAATGIGEISPAMITDGGAAGASDSITIRYSTSDAGGLTYPIKGSPTGGDAPVDNNFGCQTGDIAVIVNGGNCYMTRVTGLSAPPAAGASAVAASITLQDVTGVGSGATLACLGNWREVTYRVDGGNLERCDLATATANGGNCDLALTPNPEFVPSVTDIVNIQAQYGIGDPTAANPNRIVQWVDAAGAWAAPAVADRNRIKAIRVAVVARNRLLEKEIVTGSWGGKTCSSLVDDAPNGVCSWPGTSANSDIPSPAPAIDLSGDPDWQRYRYRVFETIIPLRNTIWSKGTI